MPIKYTYKQVQDILIQHKCVLISDQYQNQLQKLEYTASCGHKNVNILKQIIRGVGRKCRNCALEIPTYDDVVKKFADKHCMVTMTQEDFIQKYKTNKCKIKYNASCGHENIVSYKNFTTLNQGINCRKCVNKNASCNLKELYSNDNKLSSLRQELKCINYFTELIRRKFVTNRPFDGCKADIAIKSVEEIADLWLGVQVKTTNKKRERGRYKFGFNNTNYDDCLLLCICDEDKRMWLIPYEDVKGFIGISIAKKSKYNKYEVTEENLFEKLTGYYNLLNKFEFKVLDTPTCKSHQQEQEYCNIRKSKVKCIDFTSNNMEGLVYDFMIGSKKVQEKVGTIMHNNINSYQFHLTKFDCRVEGKCIKRCYELGDNDLYWLNCKNGKFYVIPEKVLFENGYLGKECIRMKLYLSATNQNTNWSNEYLFDYENVDEERLLKIVQ